MASLPAKIGGPGPRNRHLAGTGECPVFATPPGWRFTNRRLRGRGSAP